ncbi:MAG TPA: hypothetical protein VGK00_10870 [Anaerolineales bacterium]
MKTFHKIIQFLLLPAVLFACTVVDTPRSSTETPQTPLLTQTGRVPVIPPSLTVIPSTKTAITPATTPTVLPTSQPETKIIEKCIDLSAGADIKVHAYAMVMDDLFPRDLHKLTMINLSDGTKTSPGKVHAPIAISPDFTKFAYLNYERKVIVSNAARQKLKEFQGTGNWMGVLHWMDEQTVAVQNMPFRNGYIYPPASVIALNLTTGKKVEYLPEYPRIDNLAGGVPNWEDDAFTITVYNQTFSMVLYIASNVEGVGQLVLRDIINNQELIHLDGIDYDSGGGPKWFNGGGSFLMVVPPAFTSIQGTIYKNVNDNVPYQGGLELFMIDGDGKIKRLTYLTRNFVTGEEGISLSPDNSKVAFWLNKNYRYRDMNASRQLAVLDIDSGLVTNYCITGGDYPHPPVWSADNRYLLVTISNSRENQSDVLLVDLTDLKARLVAQKNIGVGWLIAP